jgi:hypothetical protein
MDTVIRQAFNDNKIKTFINTQIGEAVREKIDQELEKSKRPAIEQFVLDVMNKKAKESDDDYEDMVDIE